MYVLCTWDKMLFMVAKHIRLTALKKNVCYLTVFMTVLGCFVTFDLHQSLLPKCIEQSRKHSIFTSGSQHSSSVAKTERKLCEFPNFTAEGDQGAGFTLNTFDIKSINCINATTLLFATDLNHNLVWLNRSMEYRWEDLRCYFRELRRKEDGPDFEFEFGKTKYEIRTQRTSLPPHVTHLHLWCVIPSNDNGSVVQKQIYEDYLSSVSVTPTIREFLEQNNSSNSSESYSILLLGIDSDSRLNFHRYMPKSHSYLRDKLGAVEFSGYNSRGSGTRDSMFPLYTGLTIGEYGKECQPHGDIQSAHFVCEKFIWHEYRRRGYITAYDEDSLDRHGNYNYGSLKGFPVQPFHFDFRTAGKFLQGVTHGHVKRNVEVENMTNPCYGSRLTFEVLLKNMLMMAKTFPERKYWAHMWTQGLTHDQNYFSRFGDQPLLDVLTVLRDDNLLQRTFLIVLSDHGMRFGNFRTHGGFQGSEEQKLPFLFVVPPTRFRRKYPRAFKNLVENSNGKLMTTLDLHETLHDLLDLDRVEDQEIDRRSKMENVDKLSHKRSLFLPLSSWRSCDDLRISIHKCACYVRPKTVVSKVTERYWVFAREIIRGINVKLRKLAAECEQIRLINITQVNLLGKTADEKQKLKVSYEMNFLTEPGDAEYYVHFRDFGKAHARIVNVNRISAYGISGGACTKEESLRQFCQCK